MMPWDYSERADASEADDAGVAAAREKNARAAFLCGPRPVASAPIVNASRKA